MKWEKVKIKEICTGIYDGPHATPPISSDGAIFLGITNFRNGRLDLSEIRYISEADFPKWTKRVIPKENDIVFSYEATLNLYAIIPSGFRGCLGRRMALLRVNENKVYYKFLYYYFYSESWRRVIKTNTVLGATVDRIPLIKFPDFIVELPPLEMQYKIANILSSYDDLIENNQKQIKLLEEAAQRLYKEWFVDLRFPGYEKTPIIDGVPEGWSFQKIGKVFEIKYGKTLSMNNILNKGKYPVYGANGVIGYYNQKNCDDYVVLVTSRGNGSGEVLRTHDKESFITNNSFIIKPIKNFIKVPFIYQMLKTVDFKRICTGSAQPQLTNVSINLIDILVPSDEIIKRFCQDSQFYYNKIENLLKQNKNLKEARERLLPKLMDDELEV